MALKDIFKRKALPADPIEGGMELLARLTGGDYAGSSALDQYNRSLYVFACIAKIAEKIASIDLEQYQILNSRGDTKEIVSSRLLDLLYKPNPFQTKGEFWKTTIINLKTTGDAFWFKVRNKSGNVLELWNLRPDMVTIVTDPVHFVKEYRFSKRTGEIIYFAPEDIIHFKYPNPLSEYNGSAPLMAAKSRIVTEEYAANYQRDFFINNARPDAIIKSVNNLKQADKDELREGWKKKYQGPGKNSKLAILSGGLEYQQISLSQKEMDFIESIKANRDDILIAFGVPKTVLGITEDVNRANAETGIYMFLSETIVPEMTSIITKINEEMVSPDFDDSMYLSFKDPTPDNRDITLTEYANGITNNWLLINEVRQREGLPPIAGGWSFYLPIIQQAVGGLSQADQSKALAFLMENSEGNDKEMKEFYDKKKARVFNFKGRFALKQKLELREKILAAGMEAATRMAKKKDIGAIEKKEGDVPEPQVTEKKKVPMLKEPEMREAYAKMINKKIDAMTSTLSDATDVWARGQKDRVLANLKGVEKTFFRKIDVSAKQILDVQQENSLAADFILPYITQFLQQSGQEALAMIAPQETFQDSSAAIQAQIKKRAKEFAEQVNSTTLDKLDGTLAEGIAAGEGIADLSDRVSSVYDEFPTYRSDLIARTEATVANNQGLLEGFQQSGVANGKEWINAGDARVRVEHQDYPIGVGTEIIDLSGVFTNGLAFPQEPNCRCVLGPAFIE